MSAVVSRSARKTIRNLFEAAGFDVCISDKIPEGGGLLDASCEVNVYSQSEDLFPLNQDPVASFVVHSSDIEQFAEHVRGLNRDD